MKLRTWILGFRQFFDLLLIEKKRSDCDSYEWVFLALSWGVWKNCPFKLVTSKNQMISLAFDVVRCFFLSRRTREL